MKNKQIYYRITYNDEGIYNVLKKKVSISTWNELLNSANFKWLPKPPSYASNNRSYFTKKGYETFINKTLHLIINYLDKDNIKITEYFNITNIIYEDEYQIITNE